MKEDIAKLWVEALRSGKYTQGFGHMRGTDESSGLACHCALGVLREVGRENSLELKLLAISDFPTNRYSNRVLTDAECRWAGISHKPTGKFSYTILSVPSLMADFVGLSGWSDAHITTAILSVANLNDLARAPFERIADVIEKFWMYL
jgi:hypothetical protein